MYLNLISVLTSYKTVGKWYLPSDVHERAKELEGRDVQTLRENERSVVRKSVDSCMPRFKFRFYHLLAVSLLFLTCKMGTIMRIKRNNVCKAL